MLHNEYSVRMRITSMNSLVLNPTKSTQSSVCLKIVCQMNWCRNNKFINFRNTEYRKQFAQNRQLEISKYCMLLNTDVSSFIYQQLFKIWNFLLYFALFATSQIVELIRTLAVKEVWSCFLQYQDPNELEVKT